MSQLLEKLKRELQELEREMAEQRNSEPEMTDEECRTWARELFLAGGCQTELSEEVVEALEEFLESVSVPEELKEQVLRRIREA
ncbi:MAG: hypothetical protein ACPLRW_07080 [Moorellales bacterium]